MLFSRCSRDSQYCQIATTIPNPAMTSVPATPTASGFKRALDINSSYIEEEDATYFPHDTTTGSTDYGDDSHLDVSDVLDEVTKPLDFESEESTKTNSPVNSDSEADPKASSEGEPQVSKLRAFIVKHELLRKALHSYIGVFTLWLYTLGVNQKQLIAPLSVLFAVIFTNDYIRFQNPELNKKICKQFWFLIRESEVNSYNGTLWFLVGLVLVFSVAPKDISLMSVLLLSWADTAASTVGRKWGRYTPKVVEGKSLAGCLASAATGIISCYVIYAYYIPVYNDKVNKPGDIFWTAESSNLSLPAYALLSGLIASVSEIITLFGVDDNFSIPVLSGAFLYGVVKFFHK